MPLPWLVLLLYGSATLCPGDARRTYHLETTQTRIDIPLGCEYGQNLFFVLLLFFSEDAVPELFQNALLLR